MFAPQAKLTRTSGCLTCGEAQTICCETIQGWSNLLRNCREIQAGKHMDVVAGPYNYVHRQILIERLASVDRRSNKLSDGRLRRHLILDQPVGHAVRNLIPPRHTADTPTLR